MQRPLPHPGSPAQRLGYWHQPDKSQPIAQFSGTNWLIHLGPLQNCILNVTNQSIDAKAVDACGPHSIELPETEHSHECFQIVCGQCLGEWLPVLFGPGGCQKRDRPEDVPITPRDSVRQLL